MLVRGLPACDVKSPDPGAIYSILPDGDGSITESSGYNIFAVKQGVLYTPRRGVLEGVTRKTVLEIAEAMQCAVRVEEVPVGLIYECEEIFFCSTAGSIMPVTSLDGPWAMERLDRSPPGSGNCTGSFIPTPGLALRSTTDQLKLRRTRKPSDRPVRLVATDAVGLLANRRAQAAALLTQ